MKKPKPIEEPKKSVKKKNKKRWRKKKDPSSTLSSPDPNKASEVEQEKHPAQGRITLSLRASKR